MVAKRGESRLRDCLVVALLGAGACATGAGMGSHYDERHPCRVDYRSSSIRNASQSLSALNPAYVAAEPDRARTDKDSVIDDKWLGALVGDFERLGYFDKAVRGAAVPVGDYLAVTVADGTWVLTKRDLPERWTTMVQGFMAVWNRGDRAVGFSGTDIRFEDLQRQLEEENRRRLEAIKRGDQERAR